MKKRIGLMGVMALAILLAMSFPMMAVADDPVPPGGITEGEVITNPGYIKGAIFFGDVSKYSVKPYAIYISATGKDSQGKTLTSNLTVAKDQTQYEMVVQIPTDVMNAGGTQHYTLICYVRYGTSDEYFYFKHQEVDVPFNNKNDPKIADFVVNPGYINGPLTTNCQIKSGWIKAVLGDCGKDASCVYTRIEFVNPDPTKYANFYFPVQPNQNIRVWGEYTRTDGWTFKLEEKLVTVVEGQELYPGWAIGQCDGEPDCSAIIKGQFGLEGLGSNIVGKQNIGLTGATARHADFTTNSPYIFDGLQPGDHYLYSTIYLNPLDNTGKNFDDTFIPPHADWHVYNRVALEKKGPSSLRMRTGNQNIPI